MQQKSCFFSRQGLMKIVDRSQVKQEDVTGRCANNAVLRPQRSSSCHGRFSDHCPDRVQDFPGQHVSGEGGVAELLVVLGLYARPLFDENNERLGCGNIVRDALSQASVVTLHQAPVHYYFQLPGLQGGDAERLA